MKTEMRKAKHKFTDNTVVSFKIVKDFLGDTFFELHFDEYDITTVTEKIFYEDFEIIK